MHLFVNSPQPHLIDTEQAFDLLEGVSVAKDRILLLFG
jgi:hypothetical protein